MRKTTTNWTDPRITKSDVVTSQVVITVKRNRKLPFNIMALCITYSKREFEIAAAPTSSVSGKFGNVLLAETIDKRKFLITGWVMRHTGIRAGGYGYDDPRYLIVEGSYKLYTAQPFDTERWLSPVLLRAQDIQE